jgi:hypothetical protein
MFADSVDPVASMLPSAALVLDASSSRMSEPSAKAEAPILDSHT